MSGRRFTTPEEQQRARWEAMQAETDAIVKYWEAEMKPWPCPMCGRRQARLENDGTMSNSGIVATCHPCGMTSPSFGDWPDAAAWWINRKPATEYRLAGNLIRRAAV
jgi:hypothetical protein